MVDARYQMASQSRELTVVAFQARQMTAGNRRKPQDSPMLDHYYPYQGHMSWTCLGSTAADIVHIRRGTKSCPSNGASGPLLRTRYFVVRAVSFSCEELRREGSAQPANPLNPWHQFERRHIRPDGPWLASGLSETKSRRFRRPRCFSSRANNQRAWLRLDGMPQRLR